MKITMRTSVAKLLRELPGAREVFQNFGMECSGCMGADFEDLEDVARSNQINAKELLNELKKLDILRKEEG